MTEFKFETNFSKNPLPLTSSDLSEEESLSLYASKEQRIDMISRGQFGKLNDILDEESIKILKILTKGEITDQKIAEKMRIRPNTIRRILNEMHTKGIITYRKEKERSGWYNYIWRINPEMVEKFLSIESTKTTDMLEERLSFETDNHFFQCVDGCIRTEYTNALESEFKCPMCQKELVHYDNIKDVRQIKRQINALIK